MTAVIHNDTWEIKEVQTPDGHYSTGYQVLKNGVPEVLACGDHTFETESGAAYMILNEYSTDLED